MTERLKKICSLAGVSGNEREIREYIISEIDGNCDYRIDNLGNIIAFKKGRQTTDKRIMLAAHMDEVGFIVTAIRSDGTLCFSPVGGIDASVAVGRRVAVGERKLCGVIGSRAVHLLSKDEKDAAPEFSSLYIDIGAKDKEDAEKHVMPGDTVTFDGEFYEFGDGMLKGKAIDDRFGCEIMIDMIKGETEYDAYFVFTTREEIGTKGAKVAAFSVAPDYAIVLETTTAADVPGASGEKKVCSLGGGAVVPFMDRGTIYDRELYRLAMTLAEENGVPAQTKTMIAGGNDASAIHVSREGVRTITVSAPCRYLHSAACIVKKDDLTACRRMAELLLAGIAKL